MELVKSPSTEEEMKKNRELKKSDLDMLRDWLKKQPHLPKMSDFELILFLHSNYYRIEPTKTTIDSYFTVRTHVPEFFSARDPLGSKELREIMKVICVVPLPGKTVDGYQVMFLKTIDPNPARYVFSEVLKLFCMAVELWLYTSGTSQGHIVLIDMNDFLFSHVARLSPMLIKKCLYYLQEGLPVRLKGFYFMNTVSFMDMILSMMKPFMKKELMDVLSLHSTSEALSKVIPLEILPNEQGGKAGPLEDLWAAEIRKIEEHRDWFLQEDERRVNETVRPGRAKNVTDIFGVEGSFKKLDLD